MRFRDKVVLVTGAGRGIGLSIAKAFLDEGAFVAINDVDETMLEKVRLSVGVRAIIVAGDVSDKGVVMTIVRRVEERFGTIDILVNNAGISPKHHGRKVPVEDMPLDEWERVLRVNLTSQFLCSQAVIPGMKAKRWGRIINVSSIAGRTYSSIPGAHYMASKAGILGLTRCLAGELAAFGITVNAVCPGRIDTDMVRVADPSVNEKVRKEIPVGRLGHPEDVAHAVLFLADQRSDYITGVALDVNGGRFMA